MFEDDDKDHLTWGPPTPDRYSQPSMALGSEQDILLPESWVPSGVTLIRAVLLFTPVVVMGFCEMAVELATDYAERPAWVVRWTLEVITYYFYCILRFYRF